MKNQASEIALYTKKMVAEIKNLFNFRLFRVKWYDKLCFSSKAREKMTNSQAERLQLLTFALHEWLKELRYLQ